MSNIRKHLRDWWRGYSDEDVASAREKLRFENHPPSKIIKLTSGEFRALKVLREEREQAALDRAVSAVVDVAIEPPTDWFNSAHASPLNCSKTRERKIEIMARAMRVAGLGDALKNIPGDELARYEACWEALDDWQRAVWTGRAGAALQALTDAGYEILHADDAVVPISRTTLRELHQAIIDQSLASRGSK